MYVRIMDRIWLEVSEESQARLASSRRARARAEWVEWQTLVDVSRELHQQIDAEPQPLRRLVMRSGVGLTLGNRLGLSEGQAVARVTVAERVIDRAPAVWSAFEAGRVDGARVWEISAAAGRLEQASSWQRLDQLVIDYAERHTVAELRAWLRRFVARVEPERFNARADEERRQRRVEINHTDDGMAWINAYVPAFVAAAADRRLDARAKELGTDDERTMDQRRADLFAEWLSSSDHAPASVSIDVAVTIPVTSLSGSSGHPAVSADGAWAIPASWALDSEVTSIPFWHRLLVDPVTDDVLAHDYIGRYPPDVLRRALQFRDMTCRAPGCTKPADRCDMDHRRPWPEGPTSGDNLWALCRRHHNLKGHRVLQWVLPDGEKVPA